MEQALILTAIAFIGNKIIEALKYIRAKDWNALVTLLSVHLTTALVLLYAASAKVTEGFVVPGTNIAIGQLDNASVIFLGLAFGSLTSKLYDFQKAIDNTTTSVQPKLTKLPSGPTETIVVKGE